MCFFVLCIIYFYTHIMMRSHTEFPLDWKYGTCFVCRRLFVIYLFYFCCVNFFLLLFFHLLLDGGAVFFWHSKTLYHIFVRQKIYQCHLGMCGLKNEKKSGQFISSEMSSIFLGRRKKKSRSQNINEQMLRLAAIWRMYNMFKCSNVHIFNSRCQIFLILTYIPCLHIKLTFKMFRFGNSNFRFSRPF